MPKNLWSLLGKIFLTATKVKFSYSHPMLMTLKSNTNDLYQTPFSVFRDYSKGWNNVFIEISQSEIRCLMVTCYLSHISHFEHILL